MSQKVTGDRRQPWATVGRPRMIIEDLGKVGGAVHDDEEGYREDIQCQVSIERSKLGVP